MSRWTMPRSTSRNTQMPHQKTLLAHAQALVLASLAAMASGAGAAPNKFVDQWHPNSLEIAQLPQYCQGQFREDLSQVPGYTIAGCGGYMNHFCPGLVAMNRAMKMSLPKPDRRLFIGQARIEINYTKHFLSPGCPIAQDIEAADSRLRMLEATVK